ncbi:tellurite resistance TerB family protein [Roseovarius sp. M141]|uniref:tellurite resistance TerB family protein n=1 Tax=Roseovarius sp. M141 TaxID=2583806 RepID=UPI0020CEEA4E|nr:tellurite resistance TerB family protein [Roseovarius sp. M141]MCQ0092180.1 2-dehydro-3-deoxyphosphooctonate aldolase [Roseovarius sp. M141]
MNETVTHPLSAQDCLVAVMIAVSASDEQIRTAELIKIESAVNNLPIFGDYDEDRVHIVAQTVFDLFSDEDGLDALFGLIRDNLPERLFETAYALACDVAAADGTLADSELRLLEEIRYELNLDRLHAAAIERGARARHMSL